MSKFGYCPHTILFNEQMIEKDFAENRNFICANKSIEAHRIASKVGDKYYSCNNCRAAICKICGPTKHS